MPITNQSLATTLSVSSIAINIKLFTWQQANPVLLLAQQIPGPNRWYAAFRKKRPCVYLITAAHSKHHFNYTPVSDALL
jgi:hypothetical protein